MRKIISLLLCLTLLGCGASHTLIQKRKLAVETKMSNSIFLEPVAQAQKTVLLQIKNTSGQAAFNIANAISEQLLEKGYKIVTDKDKAHYILQANVLTVAKSNLRAMDAALDHGFGAALGGGVVGGAIGSLGNHSSDRIVVGALLGAAVSSVLDATVSDDLYSVITDVQISERSQSSKKVKEKTKSTSYEGDKVVIKEVTDTATTQWRRYESRIISTANQANLKVNQALPVLSQGLADAIAGIF